VLLAGHEPAVAAAMRRVAVQKRTVRSRRGLDAVAEMGGRGVEVEGKDQPRPFEGDHQALSVLVQEPRLPAFEDRKRPGERDHVAVEARQKLVSQGRIVHQVPLPPRIFA